jgi:MFS family permease
MPAVHAPSRSAVRALAGARLVSVAGNGAAGVALALVLYGRTRSAVWVSLVLLVGFGVPALISPLSGAIGDRFDRRGVLVASDLLGAGCFVAMALADAPGALLSIAFVAAVAAAPFLAASGALMPALAPAGQLPWANSRLAIARQAGQLAGPLIGGAMVASTGPRAAFLADAGSFLLSAGLIASIELTARPAAPARESHERIAMPGLLAGFAAIWSSPLLRALTLGFVLVDIGNGLVMPAEVVLARVLRAGSVGYGALVAGWSAGGIAAAQLAPRLLERRSERTVLPLAAAGLAGSFALAAVAPWFALALAAFAGGGATMSVAGIAEDLLLQRRVADGLRSRAYAAHIGAVQLSLALPLTFSGALVDALGPRLVFGLAAGSVTAGVLVLGLMLRAGRDRSLG